MASCVERPGGDGWPAVAEIVQFLVPELRSVLAALDGAPPSVAEATAQLLPFGSRAALEALGLLEYGPAVDDDGRRSVHLTPLAYRVAAEAAVVEERDPSEPANWDEKGRRALDAIRARARRP